MIRRPPRSTPLYSSAASDVYKRQLREYELMMIVHPDADEDARNAILDRVEKIVNDDGGVLGPVDDWGTKRFAYEIDHLKEGHYYVIRLDVETSTLDEVVRVLGIQDQVIRTMPVKFDEPVTTSVEE